MYEKIKQEQLQIKQKLERIQETLPKLPEGRLVHASCGTYDKWYQHIGTCRTYIPKTEHQLAEGLTFKRLLLAAQKDLQRKLKGVNAYLKTNDPTLDTANKLLCTPKYAELLANTFKPISREINAWANAPYPKLDKYSHQLKYETVNGLRVRSKSESLIALMLYTNKIPFHYEEALSLDDIVLYPDFTIKHPESGESYYWEHFGRLDLPEYRKSMLNKMQLYMEYDILPADKLILTYETPESPLCAADIQYHLDKHFL